MLTMPDTPVVWLTVMRGTVADLALRAFDTEAEAVACCASAQAAYLEQYHAQEWPRSCAWEDGVTDAEKRRRHREGPLPPARLYNLAVSFGVVRVEGGEAGEYRAVVLANGKPPSEAVTDA
jgi:hypothetical protein